MNPFPYYIFIVDFSPPAARFFLKYLKELSLVIGHSSLVKNTSNIFRGEKCKNLARVYQD